ncbi:MULTISPECIES: HAMP domain-containing sensor histidine kinase [unclassified Halanaerobium]|uniref:HAMP domain-containing sensor histidine kinase n=1 Tax=unclassified Halanaerobium TaxID=2641197 RepID=UPI000DF49E38|nr:MULTISPECIES: HAMP domain-containing sensor histidine kinase [unclassified Halanaerobium]RCW49842.1 signal transduction histidine kinase [Halanaerobium sp. MA284_MarDTE_T2]RCW88486.1 signal transduction histidine kinase [Halanaerobium sp. DL-01]
MAISLSLKKLDKSKFFTSIIIIILALILPSFTKELQYNLIKQLYKSISAQDSGLLLLVSAKLVMLNTLRHLPIYLGAFILAESLENYGPFRNFTFLITLIIIPVIYQLISWIYDIAFVFAGPSYLTIIIIFILHYITKKIHHIFIKTIIISLFLFSIDWLDIIPFLSNYGFGRGEIIISIREVTEFIDAEYIINFFGFTFSIIIMINALILTRVVVDYYNNLYLIEESRKKEEKIRELELEAVKSRYFSEIKHLVHDLKTPLVTIQGLSGVIDMKIKDQKIHEYTEKINSSAEKMSQMISEILYEDKKRKISIEELFDFLKIQLALEEISDHVSFNYDKNIDIEANKVRLSRALINLIDNSLKAIDPENGKIDINARKQNNKIHISIRDNGKGIPEDKIDNIWKIGYTTGMENTGLGLHFVKKVIESHGGTINIDSKFHQGTEAEIILPEVH